MIRLNVNGEERRFDGDPERRPVRDAAVVDARAERREVRRDADGRGEHRELLRRVDARSLEAG